jgi:hypothetical protein
VSRSSQVGRVLRDIRAGRVDAARRRGAWLDAEGIFEMLRAVSSCTERADESDPREVFDATLEAVRAAVAKHSKVFAEAVECGAAPQADVVLAALATSAPQACSHLLPAALESPWLHVRHAAEIGLASLGDGEVLRPYYRGRIENTNATERNRAVRGLARWGRQEEIALLAPIAYGATDLDREAALDAIEAIAGRCHASLPSRHPEERLERVSLSLGGLERGLQLRLRVHPGLAVREGEPLCTWSEANGLEFELPSPCDGEVVRVDLLSAEIVMRRGVRRPSSGSPVHAT